MKIAVPSEIPGGLDSKMCEHFGICPLFTIITLTNGEISDVCIEDNGHHQCGNCIRLVEDLSLKDISCVITRKIGMYPLNVLKNHSISAVHAEKKCTVSRAVELFMANRLAAYAGNAVCHGECECEC